MTILEARGYLLKLISNRRTTMNRAGSNEADIQAAQSQAREQARVPRSHEERGRTEDAQSSTQARTGADRSAGRRQVGVDRSVRVERLPRGARIRSGSEIRELLKKGKRKRTMNMDVFLAPSPASRSRLGLIVPKHGHKIVSRNLLKRRLREIGRRRVLPGLDERGVRADVLIRTRPPAYDVDFERLAHDVKEAVEGLCSEGS